MKQSAGAEFPGMTLHQVEAGATELVAEIEPEYWNQAQAGDGHGKPESGIAPLAVCCSAQDQEADSSERVEKEAVMSTQAQGNKHAGRQPVLQSVVV